MLIYRISLGLSLKITIPQMDYSSDEFKKNVSYTTLDCNEKIPEKMYVDMTILIPKKKFDQIKKVIRAKYPRFEYIAFTYRDDKDYYETIVIQC